MYCRYKTAMNIINLGSRIKRLDLWAEAINEVVPSVKTIACHTGQHVKKNEALTIAVGESFRIEILPREKSNLRTDLQNYGNVLVIA